MELNQYIDHTLLKADATVAAIKTLCTEAKKHHFHAVCVNGYYVALANSELMHTNIKIAAVVGFPLGSIVNRVKVYEAQQCIEQGADEIDMVLNIGLLKSRYYDIVEEEISGVKKAIGDHILKVIFENCYLTDEEKKIACRLSINAGADFIKTSTGFGTGGATFEDITLMKNEVGDRLKIKASGGIKDAETARRYIALGVLQNWHLIGGGYHNFIIDNRFTMSIHIAAKPGTIAETVLLPGDPMRAKWIAETFLENPVCYNRVRGMYGYTGTYKGKPVAVQGTGMGIPSALIYCHELITEYGVKNLIRVGSAGSFQKDIKIRDIVIAMAASSTSGINNSRFINANYSPTANFDLFMKAAQYAIDHNIPIKAGNVLSTDEFYEDDPDSYKQWAAFGILCVEMEAAGLYTIAAKFNVKALAILTISDSLVTRDSISSEERVTTFTQMVEIALGTL